MVGFNVHFDNQMLRQLFLRCGDTYFGSFFWSNPIDVMTMATQKLLEHRPFMENFQLEILEIEFNEFSHGFKTISDLDFTEMLLRYTNFSKEENKSVLKRVKRTSNEPNVRLDIFLSI